MAASLGGGRSAAGAGFLAFGPRDFVLPLLGRLRNVLATKLIPDLAARGDAFTWVVDFPLFVIGKLKNLIRKQFSTGTRIFFIGKRSFSFLFHKYRYLVPVLDLAF